jgi:exonuclease III
MLSDLTSVLATSKLKPVILAGDLNTTTQGAASKENQAAIAFGRLSAWGLVDCIGRTRASRPRLAGCKCPDGDDCSHVRTYRHNMKPESDPTQWDYAFASESIVHRMKECQVVDEDVAWKLSDHCPIVLELEIGPGPRVSAETAG